MRIEEMSAELLKFFVNEQVLHKFDLSYEEDLESFLKQNILLLKEKYKIYLYGKYDVEVFINKNIGAFINMKKVDTLFSKETIDLRIKIVYNCKFYFKTKNFNILEDLHDIYFFNGDYYINADNIKFLLNYVEHGNIIYDEEFDIESCCIKIK